MRPVNAQKRPGAVLPLTLLLLIVLLGMVAIAVDTGYICWTQGELQNTADAAALAGASQLLLPQVPGSPSADAGAQTAIDSATSQAQLFGSYHRAGGVTLSVPAEDIVVGSPANGGSAVTPWSHGAPLPNTVQVTVRRDKTANGPLPLFFGPVLGVKSWSGTATATVTVDRRPAAVTGFSGTLTAPLPPLLPIAVDANLWSAFVTKGQSPDGAVHDSFTATLPTSEVRAPINVFARADGIPEFNDTYPNKNSPGNFGLISLKNGQVSDTTTYSHWVTGGPSEMDLLSFGVSGVQATPGAPLTMYGGPASQSALSSDLQAIVGQPRVVPLFSSFNNSGNSPQYTVVGFAGVTLTSVSGGGGNLQIVLQPMMVVNHNATTHPGAQTGSTFIYPSTPIALTAGAVTGTNPPPADIPVGGGGVSSGGGAGGGLGGGLGGGPERKPGSGHKSGDGSGRGSDGGKGKKDKDDDAKPEKDDDTKPRKDEDDAKKDDDAKPKKDDDGKAKKDDDAKGKKDKDDDAKPKKDQDSDKPKKDPDDDKKGEDGDKQDKDGRAGK
jgi:hypothetical protein